MWRADEWLSSVLGQRVFSLQLPARLDEAAEKELHHWLGSGAVDFASVKTNQADTMLGDQLRGLGFMPVDELVTLEKTGEKNKSLPTLPTSYSLRWAVPDDESAVVKLASEAFRCSRWHIDPAFTPEQADGVKASWAANFFRGQRGEAMAIVAAPEEAVGFLLVLLQADTLVYDLFAVDEKHRGKGLGTALVQWTEARGVGKRVNKLRVGTQHSNVAALALYQKAGFREISRQRVWHWHRAK